MEIDVLKVEVSYFAGGVVCGRGELDMVSGPSALQVEAQPTSVSRRFLGVTFMATGRACSYVVSEPPRQQAGGSLVTELHVPGTSFMTSTGFIDLPPTRRWCRRDPDPGADADAICARPLP